MLIASYNQAELGDVLVVVTAADTLEQVTTVRDNIVEIVDKDDGHLIGFNFLQVQEILPNFSGNGQVKLSTEQLASLNGAIKQAGFATQLNADESSKFVIGYVKDLEKHPNSDHLHITKTIVDGNQELTIVSGSPNIAKNIKVVVAKVGAMMPSGQIIWPGQLRGVSSNGMICSGRELGLKNAPQKPGALILPDNFQEIGQPFDFDKGNLLF
ncbi:putative tRNA-binding protein ytpR [Paucilactobacillus hokkaidonensis JCM 18461]|uniref:Phenylalanine--tRNA ligase subunit beta n=2 Tax=Paucilactobacillus hokkaidonensis TaxID=1193095 RepID=A0ABR5Q4G9_9LACO|nr:DUF4479 and tRNA-binding domain-containing protein [Paucilactobacillus hokkaidonensis]KRO09241.1 phenylalanine--tRNA ligase subunit beta [Paucilactobacillus hokkaidonensis]BAP85428.1 putative tRNA-binding protein ytpR [Paucilactobacillus hokkaidonensis JCM 18461]